MKRRKLHIEIVPKNKKQDDLAYWRSRTPEERFSAAEELRRHFYIISGHAEVPRMQRVITIRKRNADT